MFSEDDLQQIKEHGLSRQQVEEQIRIFEKGLPATRLARACTPGDGIIRLEQDRLEDYLHHHRRAAREGRLRKFVPASGAATRMFKPLLELLERGEEFDMERLRQWAQEGDKAAAYALTTFENLEKFAFFPLLQRAAEQHNTPLAEMIDSGQLRQVLVLLLEEKGLHYADLPKGMIAFHREDGKPRTAFQEHLREAAAYAQDGKGVARLHLTVPEKHMSSIERHLEHATPQEREDVTFEISTSIQHPSTDTIAVNEHCQPFRLEGGSLHFRPGGHGALLKNLSDLGADVVFIKNVDNVLPPSRASEMQRYKMLLAGYLLSIEERIHAMLKRLDGQTSPNQSLLEEAETLFRDLELPLPGDFKARSKNERQEWLIQKLNRPIRVCGMVKAEGDPGGGPFWVEQKDGTLTRQIVETAQMDLDDPSQQAVFQQATHFNPVDIVASVRDYQGKPFDLSAYRDPSTAFITQKSKDGKPLQALELPGLWNGAMALWNSFFVEVPAETFQPVKTVNDLLKPSHQGG